MKDRYKIIVDPQYGYRRLDSASLLQEIHMLMDEQSILVVRVPNDFSIIQECALKKVKVEPWWIAIPDHINYFNFKSLVRFLEQMNFMVVEYFDDFPMEIFLLFGDIYVGNPEVGSQCHKKRVTFELSLPCLLYTSPSPRDLSTSRMPSSA